MQFYESIFLDFFVIEVNFERNYFVNLRNTIKKAFETDVANDSGNELVRIGANGLSRWSFVDYSQHLLKKAMWPEWKKISIGAIERIPDEISVMRNDISVSTTENTRLR